MSAITEDEIRIAVALRNRRQPVSWRRIGLQLTRDPWRIKRELVARGLVPDATMYRNSTAEDRARAVDLYVKEQWTFGKIEREMGFHHSTIRGWVMETGAPIRDNLRNGTTVEPVRRNGVAEWRVDATCEICKSTVGMLYCAAICEHANCEEDATAENLDAFKRFKAERKAKARLIAADARRARAHRKAEAEGTSLYWAAVRRDKARMEER